MVSIPLNEVSTSAQSVSPCATQAFIVSIPNLFALISGDGFRAALDQVVPRGWVSGCTAATVICELLHIQ